MKILNAQTRKVPTRKDKQTLYGPKKGSTPPGIHNNTKGA